jgi:hypothetical protein
MLVALLGLSNLFSKFLVKLIQVDSHFSGECGGKVALRMNGDGRVIPLVGEEGRDASGSARGIVVSKLREWKELRPVVLLIVAVHPEILFQGLVNSLGLSVAFGMVPGGKVEAHIQGLPKGPEEPGNELRATVAGDMRRDTVLREDVDKE